MSADPLAQDWQRFTHDPEDVDPPARCAAVSPAHNTEKSRKGVCLRRRDHGGYWHEGRSSIGNLVSWPVAKP